MLEFDAVDPFQSLRGPPSLGSAAGDPGAADPLLDYDWGDPALHERWQREPLRADYVRASRDTVFGRDDEPPDVTMARMRRLERAAQRWRDKACTRIRQAANRTTAPRRTSYRASRVARVAARRAAKSSADGDSDGDGEPDYAPLFGAADQLGIEVHGRSLYQILESMVVALGARCRLCGARDGLGICAWRPKERPPLVYVSCPRHTPVEAERHFAWHGVPDVRLS